MFQYSAAGTLSNLTGGNAMIPVTSTITTTGGLQEKATLKNTIYVLPNPASTHIILQSNAGTDVSYSAFDITGREVFKGSFTTAKTIDLSAYANGAYILRFESAAGIVHKKFIIEK